MNLFTPTRTEIALDYYGQPYRKFFTGRVEKNLGQLWNEFKTRISETDDYKRKHGLFGTAPSRSWQEQEKLKQDIQNDHI